MQAVLPEDVSYTLDFPKGASLEDCKRMLYLFNLRLSRNLDLRVKQLEIIALEDATDFNLFVGQCVECGTTVANTITNKLKLKGLPVELYETSENVSKQKATVDTKINTITTIDINLAA